jgi:hypothetical protein
MSAASAEPIAPTVSAADGKRATIASISTFVIAFIGSFVATTPRLIALINWDNGVYIAAIARGDQSWSGTPGYWNAHLGILHAYLLGWWTARPFGGTVIDGFRLSTAVFYAATCTIVFATARRVTGRTLVAAAFAAVWATAWVDFHYLLILEDNPLFLAPAAAVVCWCLLRADAWTWRDSLATGVLCCGAFLGSWQALPYLFPPTYMALLSPRRSLRTRLIDATLVVTAALGAMFLWNAFMAATSSNTFAQLTHNVFSRPQAGGGMPKSSTEMLHLLVDVKSMLETLGNAAAYHLTFNAYTLPHGPPLPPWILGVMVALVLLAIFVAVTWWSWRTRRPAAHVLAATLLLFSYITAIYRDVGYTALKRFDFVPLIGVVLAVWAFGELQARRPWPRRDTLLALAMIALSLVQLRLGLDWTFRQRSSYAQPSAYGRDGMSWFDYFRHIRRANPTACRYVFSLDEIENGNWNLDLTGSLWSELPNHLALVTDAEMPRSKPASWRFRVNFALLNDARAQSLVPSCAWLSDDARRLLR